MASSASSRPVKVLVTVRLGLLVFILVDQRCGFAVRINLNILYFCWTCSPVVISVYFLVSSSFSMLSVTSYLSPMFRSPLFQPSPFTSSQPSTLTSLVSPSAGVGLMFGPLTVMTSAAFAMASSASSRPVKVLVTVRLDFLCSYLLISAALSPSASISIFLISVVDCPVARCDQRVLPGQFFVLNAFSDIILVADVQVAALPAVALFTSSQPSTLTSLVRLPQASG